MGSGGCTTRRGTGVWLNAPITRNYSAYIGPGVVVRALAVYQTGLLCSLPFQGADFREPTVLGSATVLEVHVDLHPEARS